MIIARMYERIGRLLERDPRAKRIIMNAFKDSELKGNKKEIRRILEYNYHNSLYKAEYGCGIPQVNTIIERFNDLDLSHPYDNGYAYQDVKSVQILNKEHHFIQLALISDLGDIIQVIEMGEHQERAFAFEFSWIAEDHQQDLICTWDAKNGTLHYVVDGEEGKIHVGGESLSFIYELNETGVANWNHNEYLSLSNLSGKKWRLSIDNGVEYIKASGLNAYPGEWQRFLSFLHRWGVPHGSIED